jgi:hypothetical protein
MFDDVLNYVGYFANTSNWWYYVTNKKGHVVSLNILSDSKEH